MEVAPDRRRCVGARDGGLAGRAKLTARIPPPRRTRAEAGDFIYVEPVAAELWEQKLRRAREAYESVAAEFPNTEAAPVARFYSIRISYRLKEWDKAENDIDAFIKQENDPDDYIVRAMEIRYQIYQARGELEKAAEYFREVIEADLAR